MLDVGVNQTDKCILHLLLCVLKCYNIKQIKAKYFYPLFGNWPYFLHGPKFLGSAHAPWGPARPDVIREILGLARPTGWLSGPCRPLFSMSHSPVATPYLAEKLNDKKTILAWIILFINKFVDQVVQVVVNVQYLNILSDVWYVLLFILVTYPTY